MPCDAVPAEPGWQTCHALRHAGPGRAGDAVQRASLGVVVTVVVGVFLRAPVTPAVSLQALSGDPELGPLVSGTAALIDGTHVWTDYAYDDRGANTDLVPGGDATYPPNPYPGNTSDLVQVQLREQGEGLVVSVVLQTLVPGAETRIGIGFDTDRNDQTGAAGLPGGEWTTQPGSSLGFEHLLVLSTGAANARLLSWDGSDLVAAAQVPLHVDRDRNVLTVHVNALQPTSASWDAFAVAGPEFGDASWENGGAPIMDLGYLRGEDPTDEVILALPEQVPQVRRVWQDARQGDVLAGLASPRLAIRTIDFSSHGTDIPDPGTSPGLHTFLYHARADLGEGVREAPLQFAGPYQPYVVFIPPDLEAVPPAIVFMHGANQNHLANAVHFSRDGLVIDGFHDPDAVVMFPLGRDPVWDTGPAEQDLLDVTDDAIARLGLDRDRVVLSGISAGGYGTFRHAARHPDRWAGGYSIVGGGVEHLENLTNVPFRAHNGALDPLVTIDVWQRSTDALAAAETVDHRSALVLTSTHIPAPEGDCWYDELLATPRVIDPPRVRFTVPEPLQVDAATTIAPDGAYWVSDLQPLDPAAPGSARIDAVSLARSDRERVATTIERTGQNATAGADFCGSSDVRMGSAWIERGRTLVPVESPVSNGATVSLAGLAAATLDIERMSLDPSAPLTLEITADGPVELRLVGPWSDGLVVHRDRRLLGPADVTGRFLTLLVAPGKHAWLIEPASPRAGPPGAEELPATGDVPTATAALLVLGMGMMLGLRARPFGPARTPRRQQRLVGSGRGW